MNAATKLEVEDMDWPAVLGRLAKGQNLTVEQSRSAMANVLAGNATDAQLAGFIVALRLKGEASEELVGMATAMLGAAEPLNVPEGTTDVVGTGGSKRRQTHALNVSTMASFVAAACGVTVCKHGNKKASSTSGSFDFLQALGLNIDIGPKDLEACIREVGLGFAFARTFHPSMRHVGSVRAELGIPTVFNVLGPLAHPGKPPFQVVGTASIALARTMAEALVVLGVKRAWVVTGHGGYDELTLAGPSHIFDVGAAGISELAVSCEDAGLRPVDSVEQLAGGDGKANAKIFRDIISGDERGPKRDIVALNAAAALVVSGKAETLAEGVELAFSAIQDGSVLHKLEQTTRFTTVGRV